MHSTPFLFLRTEENSNVMDLTTINNRLYTIPNASMQKQQMQAQPGQLKPSFYTCPIDFW